MLVHDDGTKHTSCFLDESKDRQKALVKKIDPNSNMIVEWVHCPNTTIAIVLLIICGMHGIYDIISIMEW